MTDVPLTPCQASLLTLLSFVPEGSGGMDPVRVMKGLFVVAQELSDKLLPAEGKYDFMPYDYGPFSKKIYDDLDRLRVMGLVTATQAPGRNWKFQRLSESGVEAAKTAGANARPKGGGVHRCRIPLDLAADVR